jgi:hypothetical protein
MPTIWKIDRSKENLAIRTIRKDIVNHSITLVAIVAGILLYFF